jgi:acyl carrier protein
VTTFEENAHKELVVYYSSNNFDINPEEIKNYLKAYLPPSVVPFIYIKVDLIPLNTNGKIDFKNLPEPSKSQSDREYIGPRNEWEQNIANIFMQVLGVNKIGINDNLFSLGGHSLTVAQIAAKINETLNINCSTYLVFINPTVEMIAKALQKELC